MAVNLAVNFKMRFSPFIFNLAVSFKMRFSPFIFLMNPKTDAIFTPNLFYIRLYGVTNTIVDPGPSTFLDFIMSLVHLLI